MIICLDARVNKLNLPLLDCAYTKNPTNTIQIGSALHEESKHVSTVKMSEEIDPEQGKTPRDYRVLSNKTQLRTLLKKTLNNNRKKWDYLIVMAGTSFPTIES